MRPSCVRNVRSRWFKRRNDEPFGTDQCSEHSEYSERTEPARSLQNPLERGGVGRCGHPKAWVVQEVETLDWANQELQNYLKAHPDFRPKDLLCLLIFAYATSLLESEEIVGSLHGQDGVRDLWKGPGPAAKAIGKFRKENRALLKWGLVQILKRAVQHKFELGDMRFPSGLRQLLVDSAVPGPRAAHGPRRPRGLSSSRVLEDNVVDHVAGIAAAIEHFLEELEDVFEEQCLNNFVGAFVEETE